MSNYYHSVVRPVSLHEEEARKIRKLNMGKAKTSHPVNINIPIKIWDKVEKLRMKEKHKREDRKLTIPVFLAELIEKGLTCEQ